MNLGFELMRQDKLYASPKITFRLLANLEN